METKSLSMRKVKQKVYEVKAGIILILLIFAMPRRHAV